MNHTTINFLTAAIASGQLEDTSESYLQKNILGASDSWYNRMVRDEGEDVAKQTYLDWGFRKECTIFGAAIRPIVQSMVEVALHDQADNLTFTLSSDHEDLRFPLGFGSDKGRTAVVPLVSR